MRFITLTYHLHSIFPTLPPEVINIDKTWISFDCPKCKYLCEVELVDVRTEIIHFCHNCKGGIKLHDDSASTHTGINSFKSSLNELESLLKKFGK